MSPEVVRNSSAHSLRGQSVAVIGAGVIGLTSALELCRAGASVTVIADRFAPRVTSVVAGALWEWPPAVCGSHHDPTSLSRSKNWSALSYDIFTELARTPESGVFLRPVTFYFRQPVESMPLELRKMREFSDRVAGFVHDPALIQKNGVNAPELCDAYRFVAPMVDTDRYMTWLLQQTRINGCQIVERQITLALLECEQALMDEFSADWIINCSGLGARQLARDNVFPLRGALVRLHNDLGLTEAHCVSHDPRSSDPFFIFILPRGENRIIVGGMAEENQWDTALNLDHPGVREMWRRCVEFYPPLARARIDQTEPVRAGLRPLRPANVRLEAEPDSSIIHNYGHGGSGVTFSWGCAREIVQKLQSRTSFSLRSHRDKRSFEPAPA